MAFPAPHLRLTMGGRAFSSEQWQVGLRLAPRGGAAPGLAAATAAAQDVIEDVAAAVHEWAQAARGDLWSTSHFLDWLKLVAVGVDGRQDDSDTPEVRWTGSTQETQPWQGAAAPWPAQDAIVASLLTDRARGLASRGRIYWPGYAMAVDASGNIAATPRTAVSTATRDLIDAVNSTAWPQPVGGGYQVAIVSDVRTGAARMVTSVQVGSIPDQQRRRRNALPELYTTPLAVSPD